MKNRLLPFALLLLLPLGVIEKASPVFVNAASEYTPTLISVKTDVKNINTSNDSDAEIRSYYSGLSSLSSSELKGNNLLKNLKPILQNNSRYMNYENTKYAMMITDRDWIQSPLSGSTYSYNTAPQMHVIYRSDNGTTTSPKFTGTHEKYDGTNPEKDSDYILNKEHTWPKAMGFNKSGNYENRPPGTDLHALMMADNNVNIQHNCFPYGDKTTVSKLGSYTTSEKSSSLRNSKGWTYSVNNMTFFEPTDEFKGDIARAQFYMVARYNNLEGDTLNTLGDGSILEANLSLTNITKSNYLGTTTTDSTSSKVVSYGDLDTLLRWHKLDPVSDYEIHRNNLIDNNYQNNRNPFIDYPSWVDVIWGNSGVSANPKTDKVSQYGNNGLEITGSTSLTVNSSTTLTAKIKSGYIDTNENIIWSSSNTNIATISSKGVVTAKAKGSVTISAITADSEYYATITINVGSEILPTSITLSSTNVELDIGDTHQLTATVLPTNAVNKTVTWSSNNNAVATVSNAGLITAIKEGSATITASTSNGIKTTCLVTVKKEETPEPDVPSIPENNGEVIEEYATDYISITRDAFSNVKGYGVGETFKVISNKYQDQIDGKGDIYTSTGHMQSNSSNSSSLGVDVFNTAQINGYISSIEVNFTSGKANSNKTMNVYASNQTIITEENKYKVNSTATLLKTLDFSDALNQKIEIADALNKNYKYFAFVSNGAVYIDEYKIIYKNNDRAWARELSIFSKNFTNAMNSICDQVNGNTNLSKLIEKWNELASIYKSLTSGAKSLVTKLDSINVQEYKNNIEAMLSTYKYIVNKYSSLEAFISGYKISNSNFVVKQFKYRGEYIWLLISFAILFVSLLVIYLAIRKNKFKK